jgi:GTPase SAR1 family protein
MAGDVGGQKTLRSYWRNYFEKTDALIWVVDATDRLRIEDCRDELHGLLLEEVRSFAPSSSPCRGCPCGGVGVG